MAKKEGKFRDEKKTVKKGIKGRRKWESRQEKKQWLEGETSSLRVFYSKLLGRLFIRRGGYKQIKQNKGIGGGGWCKNLTRKRHNSSKQMKIAERSRPTRRRSRQVWIKR